jgi:hypothetical protein
MNRNILAIATALLAAPALFASAAQACISCEYVPEVVRSSSTLPHTGHYYAAEPYAAKERVTRPAKRSFVSEPVAKFVKREPVAKTVDTAETVETAPVKKVAKNENSSISAAAQVATTEPAKDEPKVARNESSSISLASTEVAAPAKVENTKEAAAKPVDCKMFFPSVGITLSVPCE